ncbi:MAG: DUF1015 domain-containing protein [Pyrinomonadaceae bacterium]
MAVIKPFRALRPVPEMAKQVACMPYDVVSEAEAREFISHNPQTFLRVTRPEAAVAESVENDTDFNIAARQSLDDLVAKGIFTTEVEDSVYIYRLQAGEQVQTGVVACCSIDEYETGLIKRHEKTRPDKVKDRTDHMVAVGAQTGLIFLAYRGTTELRVLIEDEIKHPPLYDFPCASGVRHTVWKAIETQKFVDAFAEVPVLYIADGHHRAESAARARSELRDTNPGHTGFEDYNYVIAGIFPAEDLKILAYNRVVTDLAGLSQDALLERIRQSFIISDLNESVPRKPGEICMYLGGKWRTLEFAVDFIRAPDVIEGLDVSILQDYILSPIFGIGDPRTDERIGFVGGIRGTGELIRLVDSGQAAIAFSLFPTTMNDLFAVSDIDEIMPPKSTWFEPKLKDGLLVHTI